MHRGDILDELLQTARSVSGFHFDQPGRESTLGGVGTQFTVSGVTGFRQIRHRSRLSRAVISVEIADSARKHGIEDDDIRHALRPRLGVVTQDPASCS